MRTYLVGVCEIDRNGKIYGTHHVSSHHTETVEEAKAMGLNDTMGDWAYDYPDDLHVLFVMAPTEDGTGIEVLYYDEGAF